MLQIEFDEAELKELKTKYGIFGEHHMHIIHTMAYQKKLSAACMKKMFIHLRQEVYDDLREKSDDGVVDVRHEYESMLKLCIQLYYSEWKPSKKGFGVFLGLMWQLKELRLPPFSVFNPGFNHVCLPQVGVESQILDACG